MRPLTFWLTLSVGLVLLVPAAPATSDGEAVDANAGIAAPAGASPPDTGGDASAAQAAPLPRVVPGLQLYGVVIVEPGNRLAFIQDGSRLGQLRKVREGQTIGGALVKSIRPDRVILVSSGGEVNLMLRTKKDGSPVGLAQAAEEGAAAGPEREADDISPQPLRSSDLGIPLINRQPLYPE